MFDIGFTELLLIGVVALIVVGPEKLPGVIRTGLRYFRQFKSGVAHIRDEVERELALEDLKKDITDDKHELTKAIGFDELHESLDEIKKEAKDLKHLDKAWAEDDISDAAIEADMTGLSDIGPQLPSGDAEADTPVEPLIGNELKTENAAKTTAEEHAAAADKSTVP